MPIDPEHAAMMGQEVLILRSAGVDGYGKRSYKAPLPIRCHIRGKAVEVTGPDGTVVTGAGEVWLDDHYPEITTSDRAELPHEGGQKGIVEVQTVYDENGPHHTKLVYGQS